MSADTYDTLFKTYSAKLPYHWHWTKAQAWQESRFKPLARSPVGALGLMQIMPATGREIAHRTGLKGPLTNPKISIYYGTYYMGRMLRIWTSKRTHDQRRELAMASYNAGAGHIIQAQKSCGMPSLWKQISLCLHQVTGRHSRETLTYVKRISRWYCKLQESPGEGA